MLIKVTETNMWEREKWTYVLDVEKLGGSILNHLMIFVRCANAQFDKESSDAKGNSEVFASSRYHLEFYDSLIQEQGKDPILVNKTCKLHLNSRGNYKEGGIYLDKKISSARLKSAMIQMRDKKENKLYKNFESLFLV